MDRQRRKQAEFLVHGFCDWSLIHEIAVLDETARQKVLVSLSQFGSAFNRKVSIRSEWYYN
jgi:ssDNA thymidine ADP-ribosyltransferase, DarT